MKNKELRGILALVVVTALSFGVIAGSRVLSTDLAGDSAEEESAVIEEYDVSGADGIESAAQTENGYEVTARTNGGDIGLKVAYDTDGQTIQSVEVLEQNETESLGAKIAEPEFLDQFAGVSAPVYLPGMSTSASDEASEAPDTSADLEVLKDAALSDGTYEAKAAAPDSNGFTEQLSLTVENGAVTAVVWDAIAEDGSKKSILSENGEYTMTEDGPTWKEQSEALAQALIENQSLDFLTTDDQGKTDAVSGVSISVNSFITLASDCLNQAAGIPNGDASSETASGDAASTNLDSGSNASEETTAEASQDGTQVDAVSGATISSTAAVTGINQAYEFLQTVR